MQATAAGQKVTAGKRLGATKKRTVAKAMVEVEFRQPPAAELLMLAHAGERDDQQETKHTKHTKEESR